MSHVVVIIQRNQSFSADEPQAPGVAYSYSLPVPHDATPEQVASMVKCAYRRLEGADD